jgi:pimeloyl-ACP methyl ester carboxylesterase
MSTFVLIHGGFHGGWCWYKVVSYLERQGHSVVAPDLPSHGRDKTLTASVSFQTYVDSVCGVVDAQTEPVILAGHSMGGAIITQVAEHRPDKIRLLVYVSAFLLSDGQSILSVAEEDTTGLVLPNLVFNENRSIATLREESLKEIVYADCPEEDIALAKMLLVPQAIAPLQAPVHTTPQRFGRVPRAYVECLQDKALSPAVQKRMYAALPCRKVASLDTSHSPFFSAPGELAGHLASV